MGFFLWESSVKAAETKTGSSSLVRDVLLEHPLRRRLLDNVSARPGFNKNQLSKRVDVDRGLVVHHLGKLSDHGVIATRELPHTDEKVCFDPEDLRLWDVEETRVLFGHQQLLRVAYHVVNDPGVTTRTISRGLEMTADTVRYHLRRLKDRQLIEHLRVGDKSLYRPETVLESWSKEARSRGVTED